MHPMKFAMFSWTPRPKGPSHQKILRFRNRTLKGPFDLIAANGVTEPGVVMGAYWPAFHEVYNVQLGP